LLWLRLAFLRDLTGRNVESVPQNEAIEVSRSDVKLARTLWYLLFVSTVRKTQAWLLSISMESSQENRKTTQRFIKIRSLFPGDFLDDWLAILKRWPFNAHTPGDLRCNHAAGLARKTIVSAIEIT